MVSSTDVNASVVDNLEKYVLRFNGTKFLRVVIWFVEEHEVAMAPAFRQECFFTDFELFQFYSGRTNKL